MNEYTLTVDDIRKIIPMGRRQAYSFVKSLPFAKKIGGKIYIPARPFWKWYEDSKNEPA